MDDANQVHSRIDLAEFIDSLRADLAANPTAWENADLPRFLGALAAYVRDMPGRGKGFADALKLHHVDWQVFAVPLAGARVYE